MKILRFILDQSGGVFVEATIVMLITLTFTLGSIEFLNLFYQWNMANKAAQLGARIAAVSDPVASDLPAFDWTSTTLSPGDALLPNSNLYSWTCNGATASCSGTSTAYDADAMKTIVFGRNWLLTGNSSCDATNILYLRGMCHIFPRIGIANVTITYKDTGLGFAYRPDGPIPTIIVQLQNLPFQFFFLSGLMGFTNIQIPAEATTITGEDQSSVAP